MKNRLVWCVLVLIALAAWSVQTRTTENPPILVPGHYVVSNFPGVTYHAIQPTEVRVVNGNLVWHMAVFYVNGPFVSAGDYAGEQIVNWGLASDVVVVPARDYDDDGIDDPAVYRPSNQTWYVLRSGNCSTQNYACMAMLTVP